MEKSVRRVQVVGIGSGIGLDEIGWRIVERLAGMDLGAVLPGVELTFDNCAVPAQLPTLVRDVEVLALIDAMPAAQGSVQRLNWRDLADAAGRCSSHGVDLRQALELLVLIEPDLPEIRVYGVGIGDHVSPMAAQSELFDLVNGTLPMILDRLNGDLL